MSTPWRQASRPRKIVRDFHRQRYGNPLFPNAAGRLLRHGTRSPKRSGGGGPSKKRIAVLMVCLAAAAGTLWYLFWSPALAITAFEVEGASAPTEETVRKALDGYAGANAFLIFPRRNILLFSEAAARAAVEKAVFLEGVEIRKKLPGVIVVTVREKTVKAVLERTGRLFALDGSGFVVRELSGREVALMGDLPPGMNAVQVPGLGAESMEVPPAPAPSKKSGAEPADATKKEPKNPWPLILDRREDGAGKDDRHPGAQAFSAATIGLILQANSRLPDVAGEAVRWFVPDEPSDSVDVTMAGDWHIYLATNTPFDVQAERLSLVLKEKIGDKRPALEYVDLRYNERIFYRLRDSGG